MVCCIGGKKAAINKVIYSIWDIGNAYPDNVGATTYSVVLDGPADNVCLDVSVTIDTIEIVNGASLRVTQPDPACAGAARATVDMAYSGSHRTRG